MSVFSVSRLLAAALLLSFTAGFPARAQAPAPNTTQWENDALNLRLFYPSDLLRQDPAKLMHDGHLSLVGISNPSDPKLAEATRCLKPVLFLELPHNGPAQTTTSQPTPDGGTRITITPAISATVVLAELDPDCLTNEQQLHNTSLLADMAAIVTKTPGMKSIAQPSSYTIGWQKVYMAAAQGQPQAPQDASQPPTPLQLFTMGVSTNWNSHLLVWYFSSNNIDTLNRITKTTARFGRAEAAPLYPVVIGTTAH